MPALRWWEMPSDASEAAAFARLKHFFVVTHLTMVYGNDKDWYDVHPLIRDLVQR